MKNHSVRPWQATIAKVLIAVMVIMSVMVYPVNVTKAATTTTPKISRSTQDILIGATYDLNIINKVAKSSLTWTSSNKKVATVGRYGLVKGIAKGTAVITLNYKTPKKTYKLVCKVTIRKPATAFTIHNKITALNVGQKYDANRTLSPSTSNDKTTWSSSNTSIAVPDTMGRFTALKVGTVKIVGKTLSKKTDSMTVKVVDKDGTVTNQTELTALLGSGVSLITIKTDAVIDLTIPSGNYSKTKLVVDAPNADVHNNGVFSSIDIKQIASNSWYENAIGNLLNVLATDSRIVVASNAVVRIDVSTTGATVKVENNGIVEEVRINKAADLDISGTSTNDIPVVANVENIIITTSVPLNLNLIQKINLVLLAGSEASIIKAATAQVIPNITGNSTVTVTVGTGTNTTQQEVIPTPLPTVTPTPTTTPTTPPTPTTTPDVTKTVNEDGSVSYTLAQPYTQLSAISVGYHGATYSIDTATLATLKLFLGDDTVAIALWKATTDTTNSYNGQSVNVSGVQDSSTKTVTFTGGQLDGKSYLVTVGTDNSITVTNIATNITYTVTKIDNYTLKISGNNEDLTFTPTFN